MNNKQYWIYVPLTKEDQEILNYTGEYEEIKNGLNI